ncbi:MAG: thioredoxin fold domain-containing protein, partial [Campylobacterota bacterium]|nr:thioredoxin fold domain-containing protein [Campylobacterota bacterium]
DTMVDTAKLQEIKVKNKILQNPNLQLVGAVDKPGNYLLKLEGKSPRGSQLLTGFLDKKTGELHIGTGYDRDGKPILFPKDADIVKAGVSFSYGKGSKDLYLVTDPECPYCIKFEKAAEGKLGDYTVHVILYPLPFHKKAPAMAEWIMQGKSDAEKKERLSQITLKNSTEYKALITDAKKPFKYTPDTQKRMNRSKKAARELGARGTPATYDDSFTQVPWSRIVGAVPKEKRIK